MSFRSLGPSRTVIVVVAAALFSVAASAQPFASPETNTRRPVLVELFTSEGCSDCPPADALLAQLDATQFVPGAQAIVLSEHVTYWNHEGWSDPFSFEAMTDRQQNYVAHFGIDSSYTPQIVVDGAEQFVGGDVARLSSAVAKAAATPKQEISIEKAEWIDGSAHFSVRGPAGSNTALVAVLAENATRSVVRRGENAGRTLQHVAVVRVIKDFGSKGIDGRQLDLPGPRPLTAGQSEGPLRLVVFLIDRKTGHVVAAAEQDLRR
jgi:hypothetical protein